MTNLLMVQTPICKRPLLLYLATSSYAIGALIAQEDGSGVEQPIYYISRALKDAETRYPRAERACLAIYDLKAGTPKAVKSQTITDLLAQFPREEEFPLDDKVPREVPTIEVIEEQWVMKFDSSSTTHSRGAGIGLYHGGEEAVALSFRLEFSCSNNTTEYEAYLTG
ncbi:uncharacterized protein LOC142635167 [Castanea sativa]|uniref:uncharacterized protein LOC142635167 n=1 Tax=Castanea sativa TaxID=21020 RepID=UPI003F64EBE1